MIILNLQGGLGNQIYQYNFALLLANRLQTKLVINNEIIRRGNFKNQLSRIGLKHERLSTVFGYILYMICSLVYKLNLRNLINSRYIYFYLDHQNGYDPSIENLQSKIIFLNGYFQSHQYLIKNFYEIQERIYSCMPKYLNDKSSFLEVCVHVRRGDYLDAGNKDIFFQIDMKYYLEAMNIMKKKYGNNLIFKIFSNDIEFCKNAFVDSEHQLIFINNFDPIEDFMQMINCDHYIIANSTFSLLTSIYSKSKEKFVIAPQHWFKKDNHNELIPKSYLRI